MRLIDADRKPNKIYKVYAAPYASYYKGYIVNEFCIKEDAEKLALGLNNNRLRQYNYKVIEEDEPYENYPTVEAIPVWYIIRWYEKRYKLGSTVADDWERGFLKEKIAEMYDDFKNEKYLDNKESGRYAQMVKEVIELYNDWEKEKVVRPTVSLVSGSVKFSDNVTITQINNDIGHGTITAISSKEPDPNLKLVGNKEEKENG